MASSNNCKFGDVYIGDYGWVVSSFAYNLEVKEIPRATGAIINNRGGGYHTLVVHAWVSKTSRKNLEEYLYNLGILFSRDAQTLTVNDKTYTNCYFTRISPGTDYFKWNFFSVTFIKAD